MCEACGDDPKIEPYIIFQRYRSELKKIIKCEIFKKYFDKFKYECNSKNYIKLIKHLRKNIYKFSHVLPYTTFLLRDSKNKVIFNSKLSIENSFENYINNKIIFNNKYQYKSSKNIEQILKINIPYKTNQMKHVIYFSEKIDDFVFTIGQQTINKFDGCIFCF